MKSMGPPPPFHDLVADIRYTEPPCPKPTPPNKQGGVEDFHAEKGVREKRKKPAAPPTKVKIPLRSDDEVAGKEVTGGRTRVPAGGEKPPQSP